MRTWRRGRKPATQEQKLKSKLWQNERVKIANLVARKPEIEKICCICGKPGKILHNRKNPYFITFICDECKKDPNNIPIAETYRFDIRNKLDKTNLCVSNFTDQEIVSLIIEYMNDIISVGDFCEKHRISRHQFNQVIQRYKLLFPKQDIESIIKLRANKIQSEKLKKITNNKLI